MNSVTAKSLTRQRVTVSHPDYDALPEGVKLLMTPKEHAWLGDEERNRIIERECMPDMDVTE